MNTDNTTNTTDINTTVATADVLGGTDTAATETATAATATTPGKIARAARKANGEKRSYTPRGTTYWARRVILLNGAPVGRGRPSTEGKGERKVVYVPVGMEYDKTVHGEGVRYNAHSHRATHKRIAKDSVSYTFDDGVAPTKSDKKGSKGNKNVKGDKKGGKGGKPAKKGNSKPAKKSKPVTVPVADVPAATPVVTAPVVDVPVSTDPVTA